MKTDKHLRGTQNDKGRASQKLTKHDVNIRNRPLLHFQIGLVLSLIAVYAFIEIEVPIIEVQVTPPPIEDIYDEPMLAEVIPTERTQTNRNQHNIIFVMYLGYRPKASA